MLRLAIGVHQVRSKGESSWAKNDISVLDTVIVTEKNIGFRVGSETRGQSTTANREESNTGWNKTRQWGWKEANRRMKAMEA